MWTTVDKDLATSSTTLTIITIVFCCQFFRFVTTSCNVNCTCQQLDNGSHVICRHLESASSSSLSSPEDVFKLEIEDDDTHPNDVIANDTFAPLQNLRHLAIRRCGVTKITRLAFAGLAALQVLILSDNFISDLAVGSFEGLNNVRKIFIDGNRLSNLPHGLFMDLDLDFVDLSDNLFVQIPGDSFAGSSVRALNLNLNSVASVEESSFHWLGASLRELTLSFNRCPLRLHATSINRLNLSRLELTQSQLNDTSFLVNSTLIEVDISGNVPTSSEAFWSSLRLPRAEILYARNLSLNSLPVGSLALLTNAKVLDFSENRLSVVIADVFRATPQLRSLNIALNSIGRLGKGFSRHLGNLESLNLSGNALRFLFDDSLSGLTRLRTLDLSGNRLQFISETMFRLASVTTRVEGNPLHCNCQLLWLRRLLLEGDNVTSMVVSCASPFVGPIVSTSDDQLRCSTPSILPLSGMMDVTEGDDLLLTCSAVSDPPPSISWTNDRRSILMSVAPSVTQDRNATRMSGVLGMRGMSLGDAGTYTCHAWTDFGNASATLTVNVLRKVIAPASTTSSVERPQQSIASENAMSADALPTSRTAFIGTELYTMNQTSLTEVRESQEEFSTVVPDDITTEAPVLETTESISTDRQYHTISVDFFEKIFSRQRPTISSVEPFTTQLTFSRNTPTETHELHSSGSTLTNIKNSSRRLTYTSSTTVTNSAIIVVQENVSSSSDSELNNRLFTTEEKERVTPGETWENNTETDLSSDSIGSKGEAKVSAVGSHGIGIITSSVPVVAILVAIVGLVILSGIGTVCWFKKHRRCGQYTVRQSPRRSAAETDAFDLHVRCYDNEVTHSLDSVVTTRA